MNTPSNPRLERIRWKRPPQLTWLARKTTTATMQASVRARRASHMVRTEGLEETSGVAKTTLPKASNTGRISEAASLPSQVKGSVALPRAPRIKPSRPPPPEPSAPAVVVARGPVTVAVLVATSGSTLAVVPSSPEPGNSGPKQGSGVAENGTPVREGHGWGWEIGRAHV